MLKIIIALLFVSAVFASDVVLQRNYYISSSDIMLSDILDIKPKDDFKIATFYENKHLLRLKAQKLQNILKQHNIKNIKIPYSYIHFKKKSPIKLGKIKNEIQKYYKQHYKNIQILDIWVEPTSYMAKLPQEYKVQFQNKRYLKNRGILYIIDENKREYFFNYTIKAKLNVYKARDTIQKDEPLSTINLKKKSIILDKFLSMPLDEESTIKYQAKHRIKKNKVITYRDVKKLNLIRRGSEVNVLIKDGSLYITFQAKSLNDGTLGDVIELRNSEGKKVKAIVTGKNRAELR